MEIGDYVLELHVLLYVLARNLSASTVERAVHQDRGGIAQAEKQLRPTPEVEDKFVQERG